MELIEIKEHAQGRPIVVVQGLGFVGSAVCAVIAAARDTKQAPRYFVVGLDLPTPAGQYKVNCLNAGQPPFAAPDPELPRLLQQAVVKEKNLVASTETAVLGLADIIVVDIPLDVKDRFHYDAANVEIEEERFLTAIRTIGQTMPEDALVLVETTVPAGMCEKRIAPLLREERAKRGIEAPLVLAHAYERVMPGPNYVRSIRNFWRTYAGVDERSAQRAKEFLESYAETQEYPPTQLADTNSSELAKILENSYRAMNIAFIEEWTRLAEQMGVNLWAVVDSIRVRKGTHDNMRYPGFGVGGYCLTKDSLLAQWSSSQLFQAGVTLDLTLQALEINNRMPLHALDLLKELLGGSLQGQKIALCGISYLPGVGDTRNSPAEVFYDALRKEGAEVTVHDPYVTSWPERPEALFTSDLAVATKSAGGVVFAVKHAPYRDLLVEEWKRLLYSGAALVDAENVFSDEKAAALHEAGHRIGGVGKGHWRKQGLHS